MEELVMIASLNTFRYEDSDWGWNDKQKKEEMTDESAWYLVARDADNKPVAIVHFRFDLDEEIEVLYWSVTSVCNQLFFVIVVGAGAV